MYINESLAYSVRHDLSVHQNCFESIFIEIENNKNKNVIVGIISRPPGSKYC